MGEARPLQQDKRERFKLTEATTRNVLFHLTSDSSAVAEEYAYVLGCKDLPAHPSSDGAQRAALVPSDSISSQCVEGMRIVDPSYLFTRTKDGRAPLPAGPELEYDRDYDQFISSITVLPDVSLVGDETTELVGLPTAALACQRPPELEEFSQHQVARERWGCFSSIFEQLAGKVYLSKLIELEGNGSAQAEHELLEIYKTMYNADVVDVRGVFQEIIKNDIRGYQQAAFKALFMRYFD